MSLPGPARLEGRFVALEPLRPEHLAGVEEAARGLDWSLMSFRIGGGDDALSYINAALSAEASGEKFTFAVRHLQSGSIAGCTSYTDMDENDVRLEIGGTWYAPKYRGTEVNPECKYLLLKHAFEDWGAVRVQLKTDNLNLHSQRAILKLGARFEGVLRSHRRRLDGSFRDTHMYSIIREEWPAVASGLLSRLDGLKRK